MVIDKELVESISVELCRIFQGRYARPRTKTEGVGSAPVPSDLAQWQDSKLLDIIPGN